MKPQQKKGREAMGMRVRTRHPSAEGEYNRIAARRLLKQEAKILGAAWFM